jgi:hypothetical protein
LGENSLQEFYNALVITGQDALAELLTESKNVTPMTEAEKNAALAKYSRLVRIRFQNKKHKLKVIFSSMIECARRHILHLCDNLHEQHKSVFSACNFDNFECGYITPDLVKLQYDDRTFSSPDGRWKKVGESFGHNELVQEIVEEGNRRKNILVEVVRKYHFNLC